MPELPEVEVTRLSVVDRICDATVVDVRLGKPLRWPLGCEPANLLGRQVLDVQRRGKYLWFVLSEPHCAMPAGGLLLHLGMSGSLSLIENGTEAAELLGAHDHFDLQTTRGHLRLHDPRRFGAVVWGDGLAQGMPARLLSKLGVEPLTEDWTPQVLRQGLQGRSVSVKQALLAGDVVVGVGNIYASEALFRARIHPQTLAADVGPQRCKRLVDAVRSVLQEAVQAGGSTLKDFKNAQGDHGHFQLSAAVYGRQGEPCRTCSSPIKRVVQGQRATYFCPRCQL
jgi:formamidopyrimidine-DNA glycosylase